MARLSAANALVRAGGYYLGRLFGGNRRPLEQVARQSLEICPRLQFRAWQPYFDPRHLSRIEDAVQYTAKQIIEEHLLRQQIEFAPVRVNWIDDVWIIDGSVFVPGGQRIELRNVSERRPLFSRMSCNPTEPFAHYEFAALVGTCAGSTWFGHWLEDEVPLHMLATMYSDPVAQVRREYPHERGYLEAFGLPIATRVSVARFGTLVIVDEFAQNPHKTLRYQALRDRLRKFPEGHERVFLLRGKSGTERNLVNELALADVLGREGFHIVDIAKVGFNELLRACRGASVVVGVEGSHLAHALFMMRDYGTLLILNPPRRVMTTVADIGVFCRLSSGMFVCEPAESGNSDFFADPSEVRLCLERLLRYADQIQGELRSYVDEVMSLEGSNLAQNDLLRTLTACVSR